MFCIVYGVQELREESHERRITDSTAGVWARPGRTRLAEALRVVWRVRNRGDRWVLRIARVSPGPVDGCGGRAWRTRGRAARRGWSFGTRRARGDACGDDRGQQPALEQWPVCDGQWDRA